MQDSPILEVKGISRYFGGLAALNNVTFQVRQGEILGIIGPNGAGKTTLFNVINGFYKPSKGEIYFKGQKISGLKPHKICKMGIARTFQVVKPLKRMTVLDNVIASAYLRTSSDDEARQKAKDILVFTGLESEADVPAQGLPLGRRKIMEIARALATEPELMLVDESFAGLNPAEQNECIEILKKIHQRGITILIIEHHMKVIMSICHRVVVLNYGEKIAEGSPEEVANNPVVIEAYLGEAVDA